MDERALRFRCRRGMKELDLVLVRYLDHHYAGAPLEQREAFVAMLNREDPELYAWLLGDDPPDDALCAVVTRLRMFR